MSNIQNAYKYLSIGYHMKYAQACIEKLWDRFPPGYLQCLWLATCLRVKSTRPMGEKVIERRCWGRVLHWFWPCNFVILWKALSIPPKELCQLLTFLNTVECILIVSRINAYMHSLCQGCTVNFPESTSSWFMFSCFLSGSTSENYWSSGYIVPYPWACPWI